MTAWMGNLDFVTFYHIPSILPYYLSPMTKVELENLVKTMKNWHSEGAHCSSTYLLKQPIGCYSQVLVHLVNLCFKHGSFPEVIKTARVNPLNKGGNKQDPSNYRPISILSAFSKAIEECIYNRLNSFLKKRNFFSPFQFGFRSSYSTENAILKLTQFLNDAMDKGLLPATIFIDIKKSYWHYFL